MELDRRLYRIRGFKVLYIGKFDKVKNLIMLYFKVRYFGYR